MVQFRYSIDLRPHQAPGIHCDHNGVPALGLILPNLQASEPRTGVPVDMAGIIAGNILTQGLELAAFTTLWTRLNSQLLTQRAIGEPGSALRRRARGPPASRQ